MVCDYAEFPLVWRFAVQRVRIVTDFAARDSARSLHLGAVVAKRFDELDAWQLANRLKLGVYKLMESGTVTRDFDFYDDLRRSAKSGPSNIAEGFGRYAPPQFRHFLDIAIASLSETGNHLHDGVDRKHFTGEQIAPLLVLVARACGASIALKASLKNAKPPEPKRRRRPKKPPNRRT